MRFLQENGIVVQYSMLGDPQQNGVTERCNRTQPYPDEYGEKYANLLHIID
jgi:transposase InsO family protein